MCCPVPKLAIVEPVSAGVQLAAKTVCPKVLHNGAWEDLLMCFVMSTWFDI